MTICEKFKLMMASFADIKAAIIEKGVTVTGGYSEYAKNIHKIYSDENYTPEYQYPTEKPPIMQYLINLYNRITFCYAVKQEIRQAIIDGGVDVPDDTPFSEYGDKIRQIQRFEITTSNLYLGEYKTECRGQLTAQGGSPPYSWEQTWGSNIPGITMTSDGTISGTPMQTGGYNWGVQVTDSNGKTLSKDISISVRPKTLNFKQTGERSFLYDGQPHTITAECINDSDVEFEIYFNDNGSDVLSMTKCGSNRGYVRITSADKSCYRIGECDLYMSISANAVNVTSDKVQSVKYDGQPHSFNVELSKQCDVNVKYKTYSANDDTFNVNEDEYTTVSPTEIGKYRVYISSSSYGYIIRDTYAGYNKYFGILNITEGQ